MSPQLIRDIISNAPNQLCEYQNFPGQKWCRSEPSKHEALTQCYFNVGPPSLTSEQHYNNIGSTPRVCWEITEALIPFSESFIKMLCVVTLQRQQPAISKLPAHLIIQWGSVQLWQYHRKSTKTPISMISSETVGARIKNDNVWWNDNIRPKPLKQWLETEVRSTVAPPPKRDNETIRHLDWVPADSGPSLANNHNDRPAMHQRQAAPSAPDDSNLAYARNRPRTAQPSEHKRLNQRRLNVGPSSATLGQHLIDIGWTARVCYETSWSWPKPAHAHSSHPPAQGPLLPTSGVAGLAGGALRGEDDSCRYLRHIHGMYHNTTFYLTPEPD